MPTGLNQNPGQKSISFYMESGNQISLKGNLKNEDTDMIRLFTNMALLLFVHKFLFDMPAEIKKDTSYPLLSSQVLLLSKSNTQLASQ
jgi:hypothetical protein